MEAGYAGMKGNAKQYAKVAEEMIEYAAMPPAQLEKKIAEMEQQMYTHAQNLEFEEAGRLRDEIAHIRENNMEIAG